MDDRLRLQGVTNFRSLGGLPAAGGQRIRPHALMRADRLRGLSAADWRRLRDEAGLATICDLRSAGERDAHPNDVPAASGIREVHCEIRNDLRADASLAALLFDDPTARGAERIMVEIYRRFPGYMGDTLRTLSGLLLEGAAPLLVHCSAGKDRTGFSIAMLLHALEVPPERIWDDYLASRGWTGAAAHRASLGATLAEFVPPAAMSGVLDAVLDVRESYLQAALDVIAADYGTLDRYLEAEAGLDAARRSRLQDALLA